MSHSFGAEMRKQREQREIALATIAEKTKIKQSLLEAMERDDLSQWPNGFFRRAFMRAYAQAIGLGPDEVVRDFVAFHDGPIEQASAISSLSFDNPRASDAPPPTRLRQMVGSAVTRFRSNGQRPAMASDAGVAVAVMSRSPRTRAVTPATEQVPVGDLLAVANLCTKFGRTRRTNDLSPLLQETARILDASGLIIWTWDSDEERLRPSWAHGYAEFVLAQLPAVPLEAENAVAAAYRSMRTSYVATAESGCGAIVVPLLTAERCVGVLAIELHQEGDSPSRVEALAMIFAAQIARVVAEVPEGTTPSETASASGDANHDEVQALMTAD
jgi:helix-turn-helix protein/GAF domain-containing protein